MAPTSSFNIVGEGLVFCGVRSAEHLDEALRLFSRLLAHKHKDATFNALSQGIHANWSLHDDVVNPLGDKRQALVTVYTFDLDKDILYFSGATQNLQIPLSHFRTDETGLRGKMKSYESPSLSKPKNCGLLPPYWKPRLSASARSVPFVERVLSDFGHLWRHILRRDYSEHTFRQFAHAILCIGSLDIDAREVASRWLHTSSTRAVRRIKVVLDQDLEQALSLADADVSKSPTAESGNAKVYLLLSVRHVALCEVVQNGAT
ncbi:hypothetical protein BKA65DRAFT_481358 [Rhexocercosporidium sp. MPI-PUGE-AT-0058]|nr:hypothetical protein BKA65DRAFT_481358 [Rhexocercosporidium sp. MPI-PUGE-AT-0058]